MPRELMTSSKKTPAVLKLDHLPQSSTLPLTHRESLIHIDLTTKIPYLIKNSFVLIEIVLIKGVSSICYKLF